MHIMSKNQYNKNDTLRDIMKKYQSPIIECSLYFLLFLFVFGAMIPRLGYHWDETLDFCGGGMDTYIPIGRWGLAAWKAVFGYGPGTWTAGLLVGVFSVATIMCQLHLLEIERLHSRVIYALAFICIPQTAYMMTYSIQSDAVLFGVFATSLAAYLLTLRGWDKCLAATALVTLSVGIYQALALNFVITVVLVVFIGCLKHKNGLFALACKGVAVLIAAMLIWVCLDKATMSIFHISEELSEHCKNGHASMVNHDGITSFSSLAMYILHYSKVVVQTALWPHSYPGELIYATSIIPVILLSYHIWRSKELNIPVRLFANTLLVFLWISPFLMILVMGNVWPCGPHTRMAESVVFAALWGILLNFVVKKRCVHMLLLILGIFVIIRGSMHVSHYAATERALFEARLYSLLRMEEDAVNLALANNISPRKGNILYFRKMKNEDSVQFNGKDFCGQYPALRYLRYGNKPEELEQHKKVLSTMPSYPQEGSIRVNDGVIIICGENL